MEPPVKKGTRIVVNGNSQPYAEARVSSCHWIADEARWMIVLDWKAGGTSKVYDHDEGDVWQRYETIN